MRMRNYGQWIKMTVFGLAVVALAVTSVQARVVTGRCCVPGDCMITGYKACRALDGVFHANMTCEQRPPCVDRPLPPDRPL